MGGPQNRLRRILYELKKTVRSFLVLSRNVILSNMFRRANPKDFEQILLVQQENLLQRSTSAESGFLVYPITRADLEIGKYTIFVIVEDNQIQGYFAGCRLSNEMLANFNTSIIPENCFYWKHVALASHVKGGGIIKEFETFCFSEINKEGYQCLVGEICLNPLNKRSLEFHTYTQGLEKIDEYKDLNGYTWGIFIKKLIG
jgi:hypothetical protein